MHQCSPLYQETTMSQKNTATKENHNVIRKPSREVNPFTSDQMTHFHPLFQSTTIQLTANGFKLMHITLENCTVQTKLTTKRIEWRKIWLYVILVSFNMVYDQIYRWFLRIFVLFFPSYTFLLMFSTFSSGISFCALSHIPMHYVQFLSSVLISSKKL